MKKLSFVALCASFLISCSGTNKNSLQIDGRIAGLLTGDTILFTRYSLPDWEEINSDTLIVSKDGQFIYKDSISQTWDYIADYRPSQKPRLISCNRGCHFHARPGDHLQLAGNTDFFTALLIKGGMYDDPRLDRILELKDSITIEKNKIYRRLRHFTSLRGTENANPDSVVFYHNLYNNCRSQELRDSLKHFRNSADDSEYAAIEYLKRLDDVSFAEFKERFSRFTPEIQSSTTGKILSKMLKVKENIEPGNIPSEFTVTDNTGKRISLSDYSGKYLLIYHWGLCPGTIWVHPRLLKLYEKYHDKGFEVLGFTTSSNEIPQPLKKDPETAPLFDQPWRTVYTSQKGNEFIGNEYYFNGVPIMMVISPEGKTLYRGFSDIYEPLSELLKEKFGSQ